MENVKLKMTNDELSRALETTSQELALAQDQLSMLQDQAARLQQEKEMCGHGTRALQRCRFVRKPTDGYLVCVCPQGDVQSDGGAAAREAESHEAARPPQVQSAPPTGRNPTERDVSLALYLLCLFCLWLRP